MGRAGWTKKVPDIGKGGLWEEKEKQFEWREASRVALGAQELKRTGKR